MAIKTRHRQLGGNPETMHIIIKHTEPDRNGYVTLLDLFTGNFRDVLFSENLLKTFGITMSIRKDEIMPLAPIPLQLQVETTTQVKSFTLPRHFYNFHTMCREHMELHQPIHIQNLR